ncbi:hypothetical protein CBR_g3380 [Chara braunii]|uniref:Uncharacterized protein n=1 Tax=Chara braunii TaxID=69332 RepID=A0A388JQT0_CHABU|nr:hypothetical protein CBR_g3380 [Chara braunii]|eukprot:GBG60137.1 hypothetical protein CBR_g3380 [Chara braunii]
MHLWSCASRAERNWAVHEGIHTKKRNQLPFEKVVQLVEITANVRLIEYRGAGCNYVLPWQWDEGMLDCQARLEVEPVRMGTRRGMTEEEITQQVALITRDPIGASAQPSVDAVFGRRAYIFRPYTREDDSDVEPIPEAADDSALRIPREINETHDDPKDEETRTYTARWAADRRTEARMTTPAPTRPESSMPPPPAPSSAPPSPVSPHELATAAVDTEEWASSLPQHRLLQRPEVIRRLRLRSPSTGMLQEEGVPSAAPVEGEVAAVEGEVAAEGDVVAAAAVEGEVAPMEEEIAAAAMEEVPSAATVEGEVAAAEEEIATAAQVSDVAMHCDGADDAEGGVERRRDGGHGGAMVGEDAMEVVAAEAEEGMEGGPELVDEAMEGGEGRCEGPGDAPTVAQETQTGPVVPFSSLHVVEARQSQPTEVAMHYVPPIIIKDWGPSRWFGGSSRADVPGVSGGVQERRPGTGDMPPPPPRPREGDPSSSPTARGSPSTRPGRSRVHDTTVVGRDVGDTTLYGRTDINLYSTRSVTEYTSRLQPGLGHCGGRTTAAREVATTGCEPQRGRGGGESTSTLDHALRAATRVVHEQTPRKRGVPRPRPVPAQGGAALGESSGAEGLGMPRGSRRQQMIAHASARVVVLRKGGDHVTIEEDDPETTPAVWEDDEDYEGEEEGEEEESESGDDDDDDDNEDEPPRPSPTHASRLSSGQTSSST